MRRSLPLVLMLFLAAPAWADTCAQLTAAWSAQVNTLVTLVQNRIQGHGSIPPHGLAWAGTAPPVQPAGPGTVTAVPNWGARNLDQCGAPTGESWQDINIQPGTPVPYIPKLDEYFSATNKQEGYTLSLWAKCDGGDSYWIINVQGDQDWREHIGW